jgi:hypothetical protein
MAEMCHVVLRSQPTQSSKPVKRVSRSKKAKHKTSAPENEPVVIAHPTLYRVPAPIEGESVASWFMRTAIRQGISYEDVEKFFGYGKGHDPDFSPSMLTLTEIARRARLGVDVIDKLFSSHRSALHVLGLYAPNVLFAKGRPAYRICSACLNESRAPYWEIRRRFALERDCFRHGKFNLPLLYVSDLVDHKIRSLATFRIRQYLRSPSNLIWHSDLIRSADAPDFALDAQIFLKRDAHDATRLAANADVFFPPEWKAQIGEQLFYMSRTLENRTKGLQSIHAEPRHVRNGGKSWRRQLP